MPKVIVVIGGLVMFLFVGYLGLAYVLRTLDKPVSSSPSQAQGGNLQQATKGTADKNLVGTWETDCLVPKANEKWAEKHQFVIEGNKAIHTRWSDWSGANNCDKKSAMTLVNKYTYTVPASGQINLTDTENGITTFDMYAVNGPTLEFGHGFRLSYAGASKLNGETEANRIDTLNTYLVYKKQ